MRPPTSVDLSPESLLSAYAQGVFPMTDECGVVQWYSADPRGVIPLSPESAFHIPSSLKQVVRQGRFEVWIDRDFAAVMRGCAGRRIGGTWIGPEIARAYHRLHELGFAHSVETWRGGKLVGGLYGVAVGAAFFGESMFYLERDASKVALVALVQRLRQQNFTLLDTQATTPHLQRFGCVDIPATEYMRQLRTALQSAREFNEEPIVTHGTDSTGPAPV